MLDHSCQVQRHTFAERGNDLYETPPVAVTALIKQESIPVNSVIWEPCCGRGAIIRSLRSIGYKFIVASDLVDYGVPEQDYAGIDFLMEWQIPMQVDVILTNPPFKIAHQFVKRALALCPNVITLHRLAFYESDRRSDILDSGMLRRIYCFRKRLPMMHRDGWQGRKGNSGMAFAWFVWERDNPGPTEIRRISWEQTK